MKGPDAYITGHYGEDQLDVSCVSCGRRFRPEDRPDLHPDVELSDVDTCCHACDTAESLRLIAQMEGEGVPLRQSQRDSIENGTWVKGKPKR